MSSIKIFLTRDPVEPDHDLQRELFVLVGDLLLLRAHDLDQPVEEDFRLVLEVLPLTLKHHVRDPQRGRERPDSLRGEQAHL